jgi:hypothetical protein
MDGWIGVKQMRRTHSLTAAFIAVVVVVVVVIVVVVEVVVFIVSHSSLTILFTAS